MTAIAMLHDKVLILPQSRGRMTESGIVFAEVKADGPRRGKVVACGPGKVVKKKFVPTSDYCKIGDEVIFALTGFKEVKIDGVQYIVVPASEILVVLT